MLNTTMQLREADAPVKIALADRLQQITRANAPKVSFVTAMLTRIRRGRRHEIAPERRLELMAEARSTLLGVSEDLTAIRKRLRAEAMSSSHLSRVH